MVPSLAIPCSWQIEGSAGPTNVEQGAPADDIKTTLDDLYALPGNIDRRCLLSVDTYHATAAVYSSSSCADLRAAQQRCSEPGASEDG